MKQLMISVMAGFLLISASVSGQIVVIGPPDDTVMVDLSYQGSAANPDDLKPHLNSNALVTPALDISGYDCTAFPQICMLLDVLDANGFAVDNLTADSFCVTQDGLPVTGVTVERHPLEACETSVCLVVDLSGSMNEGFKLDSAKAAMHRFVDNMDVYDRVAIVSFSNCVTTEIGFTDNQTSLHTTIDGLIAGGETAIFDGVYHGVNLTKNESGRKSVIAFTDGLENRSQSCWEPPNGRTDGFYDDDSTLICGLARDNDVIIYTFNLGDIVTTFYNPYAMQAFATGTGGYWSHAPTPADIEAVYTSIKQHLCSRYYLCYTSPDTLQNSEWHTTQVCRFDGVECTGICDTDACQELDAPIIVLHAETVDLSATCQPDNTGLEFCADVSGFRPPETIPTVELFYSVDGGGFVSAVMTMTADPGGSTFCASIPSEALTCAGQVEYYIYASGADLFVTDPISDPETSPYLITVCENTAPVCEVPQSQSFFQCVPARVCLPVGCTDIDGNLLPDQPTIVSGPGTIEAGLWCYTPSGDETVDVTIRCEDVCGAFCEDSFSITFTMNQAPVCTVPNDSSIFQCVPEEVCLPVGCTDPDDNLTLTSPYIASGPGEIRNGQWCYTPSTGESAVVTIQCLDQCGFLCESTFTINFEINKLPTVSCPNDTTVHWGQLVVGTAKAVDADGDETVTFSLGEGSPGNINATSGAYSWNTSGAYVCESEIVIIGTDDCGIADTCSFNVCVQNSPPTIACDGPHRTCWGVTVEGRVTATDPDGGPYTPFYRLVSFDGPGSVIVDPVTGEYSWDALAQSDYAGTFELCIEAHDNAAVCDPCSPANADTCCIEITIVPAFQVHIEKTHGTLQGHLADVALYLDSSVVYSGMGGYNFLIAYDASALTFMGAVAGQFIDDCDWEYFTYRVGANGNCTGSGCPSGEIRLVAIAEINNGAAYPTCFNNDGNSSLLAKMSFLVSNDRSLECNYVPIRFHWYECTDNTVSSPAGDTLYLASAVFDWRGVDEQNPWVEITNTTADFPSYTGPHANCDTSSAAKNEILRCLEFFNGGIDIVCADSIDARGDINLDGLAYTIADVVMFTNYFVFGLQAFVDVQVPNMYGYDPGYEGSIAASDVNADGLALTVADLVYLIRVVVGDAKGYPKAVPETVNAELSMTDGTFSINREMGAALVILAGDTKPSLLVDMNMLFAFDGQNTRVLVWSDQANTFSGPFLAFESDMISVEFGSAEGGGVVLSKLPVDYTLAQNYPNPFNPTATIEFTLPTSSEWRLTIYNTLGIVVESWTDRNPAGHYQVEWNAGNNASGVYFYRLEAGDFRATRKMVLLK